MSLAQGPATQVNQYATISVIAAVIVAPVGIVFGVMALRQIARTGERGRSLALAGLWIGIAVTAIYVLAIVFVVLVVWGVFAFLGELPPEVWR
jgi:peptidyl-prolyl cis-trans isomerase B (cyclophilin B)